MKAIKDSAYNLAAALVKYPLLFVSSIIVTRYLGAENKGTYVYLLMMGGVILPISFFGLGNAIQYYFSNKTFRVEEYGIFTLINGLLTGLFVASLVYILWCFQLYGTTGNQASLPILVCFLIALPFDGLYYVARFLLISNGHFSTYNLVEVGKSTVSAVGLLLAVVFFSDKLLGAALAFNLVKVFSSIVIVIVLFAKYRMKWYFSKNYLRSVYKYGAQSWLGNLSSRANDRLDQLIIGSFVSPTLLGVYSVAYSLVNFLIMPSNAISPVLFNEISKKKDFTASVKMAAKVHRLLFALVGIGAIALAVVSKWLIPFLYGEEFSQAYIPLMILLPGILLYSVTRRVLQKILAANGYPMYTSKVQAFAAIIGVVSYLLLIPSFKIIGAAVGSLLAYATSTVVAYYYVRNITKKPLNLFDFSISEFNWVKHKLLQLRHSGK